MKKLLLFAVVLVIPFSAVYALGQKESALNDPPPTPIELEEYAGAGASENVLSQEDADGEELVLTVERAVEIARERNLDLESRAIDLQIKERQADYAWNELIPSAQVSGTMSRMNKEQSFSGLSAPPDELAGPLGDPIQEIPGGGAIYDHVLYAEGDAPQWGVSAGLDFSLTLNVALVKAIESTRKAWQAEEISYKQAEAKLEKDVRKSFYNLLLMKEQRKLQVEQIETARERYEQARINYQSGLIPELTVLNAQVAYENQKPGLKAMDLGYRQALQGFKMNLGLDLRREISLEGSIEADPVQLDAEELVDRYIGRRYDVRSLIANINTMEDQYTANKLRAVTPTLSLGLNFDPSFQEDPWEEPWFSDISEDWSQRSGMFRLTIAMSLDGLLPFSKTQVGLRELEDNIHKMRIGLQQALRGAEMEIFNTVEQIEKSRDTLDALELNVERAERAYEMAEEAYNVGGKELLEVKDAQDELQKARFEVLKEKYNYVSALLDLEYAINTSVEDAAE